MHVYLLFMTLKRISLTETADIVATGDAMKPPFCFSDADPQRHEPDSGKGRTHDPAPFRRPDPIPAAHMEGIRRSQHAALRHRVNSGTVGQGFGHGSAGTDSVPHPDYHAGHGHQTVRHRLSARGLPGALADRA